jgi:hypothetical protein
MLGWLYTKTDDQIMEEAVEMVGALEAVACSNNITKAGEGIMEEVVQLCTLLTTSGAYTLTTCSSERKDEDDEEQGHHQEDSRDHIMKEEGAPGDKAVISACSNGMPGSNSQASPGGTCPRTLKFNPITKPCNFYQHQTGEERDHNHEENHVEADQGHHQEVGQDDHQNQQEQHEKKTDTSNILPQRKATQMQENQETKLYVQHAIMGCLDPYPRHHQVGPPQDCCN